MTCSRCQKKLREGTHVYSRHTGNRYCADFAACDKSATRAALKARRAGGTFDATIANDFAHFMAQRRSKAPA